MKTIEIPEPKLSRFLFSDTRFAWVWLIVRLYVGYEWFMAGWGKFVNPAWTGTSIPSGAGFSGGFPPPAITPVAGDAIKGFFAGALQKASGAHPDVSGWYAFFIQYVAMPNAVFFSYLITFGEIAVGVALILGIFSGIAAFFGTFMNLNYLFAGTISVNPVLFLLQLLLILAWRTAGWIGLDHYVLPAIGTPWQPGSLFTRQKN